MFLQKKKKRKEENVRSGAVAGFRPVVLSNIIVLEASNLRRQVEARRPIGSFLYRI